MVSLAAGYSPYVKFSVVVKLFCSLTIIPEALTGLLFRCYKYEPVKGIRWYTAIILWVTEVKTLVRASPR